MPLKIEKIALFLPNSSPFYISLFFAMKRGFEQVGFQVAGWPQLLERDQLLEFCRQYKPDVLFEMNRSRAQIPYLPENIIHIAWIVDLLGHPFEYFKDSEILYLFGIQWVDEYYQNWLNLYKTTPDNIIEWLPPGFCPDVYFYEPMKPTIDFSFIGHIPLPWSQNELDRIILKKNKKSITFKNFYEFCKRHKGFPDLIKRHQKILHELVGEKIEIHDRILKYDIECRSARMLYRNSMINCILSVTKSIDIYGPENWKHWPEYKLYYKTFLTDPHKIRQVFLKSRLNLHEGNGTHFRVFDCMGSGGCVFYHNNPYRALNTSGLESLFEPNKHYIFFNEDDIKEKAHYYLKNSQARMEIGKKASKLVHAKHKWSNRVIKISNDLKLLGLII